MPALALKDNKTNIWEPVGEENYYGIVKGDKDILLQFVIKME